MPEQVHAHRREIPPARDRGILDHDHHERNHQGEDIGNALLFPDDRIQEADPDGVIVTDERLGGLLKFYHRQKRDAA